MFSEFMIRAMAAGLGVALVTGVLGCFVLWRRMVYFGDALSHASILGVAMAAGFGVSVYLGVAGVAIFMAFALVTLTTRWQSIDTILGVVAHSFLAIGLIAATVFGQGISIEAVLFGDILAVTWLDVALVWGGAIGVISVIASRWRKLIVSTVSEDLAASVGVSGKVEQLIMTLCLAVVVGVALKTVGALLITAFFGHSCRSGARNGDDARSNGGCVKRSWNDRRGGWVERILLLGLACRSSDDRGLCCFVCRIAFKIGLDGV